MDQVLLQQVAVVPAQSWFAQLPLKARVVVLLYHPASAALPSAHEPGATLGSQPSHHAVALAVVTDLVVPKVQGQSRHAMACERHSSLCCHHAMACERHLSLCCHHVCSLVSFRGMCTFPQFLTLESALA